MDFSQIAIIFVFAAIFGLFAKKLKQPLFVGYLFAGVFLSWSGVISDFTYLTSFGHIGVTLLLFLMGLEMSLKDVSAVGKIAFITALSQMIASFIAGFGLSLFFGFSALTGIYIGLALSFSSTIISMQLISEKKDLVSLHGRVAIGILLVQDLFAVLVLMFLSRGGDSTSMVAWLILVTKGIVVILSVWYLSKKAVPFLFEKFIGGSNEFLFIFSIAWALGISVFIQKVTGFSLEIGGFLAGLSLSTLPEHLQIATKARPLRDFFLTIFFLTLGTGIILSADFPKILPPALILSIAVIVIHTLTVMVSMGAQGYRKRTSFIVGTTISQISEFSLIVVAAGLSLGHIKQADITLVTLVGVMTMVSSTYISANSDYLFNKFKKYLSYFEKDNNNTNIFLPNNKVENHVVLVGCDRTGTQITNFLIKKKIEFVVVDFNPKVFTMLTAQNIPVVFGDINDEEIMESANVAYSTLVILTTSSLSDNLNFLASIKNWPKQPNTIFTSVTKADAIRLYEAGASYVIVPEIVAGEHIKHLLRAHGTKGTKLGEAGKDHFNRLIFI